MSTPDGLALGKFGWKAIKPTLSSQSAAALAGDLGITSTDHRNDDCTSGQVACREAAHGGEPELGTPELEAVAFFIRYLGVPAARRDNADPAVIRGNELFYETGCERCHRAALRTRADGALASITFHAYTDLLLHDLGPDLSDSIGEGAASAREWRTPPLWGLGLVADDPKARFLHDGRAETIEEAIRAHGGEAARSKAHFEAMSAQDREKVLQFLRSL